MRRHPVSKRQSARRFRKGVSRTKSLNMRPAPQRGGWRL